MAAIIDFIQFRKASGFPATTPLDLPVSTSGIAWGFFGSPGTTGYLSPPSSTNAQLYRVKSGTASWEVLLAVKVVGISFVVVTDIRLSLEQINRTDLGTIAGDTVSALLPAGTIPLDRSGLYMRSMAGNIELNLPPEPIESIIPNTSPAWGLPYEPNGWLLTVEKLGPDPYVDIEDGTEVTPPNSANLTPLRGDGVRALYPSDLEPRYSNFAILNFVVASDAVEAVVNPVEMLVTWSES